MFDLFMIQNRHQFYYIFENYQKSIFCIDNVEMRYHNGPQHRLEWSDVVFQLHQMEAAKGLQPYPHSPVTLRHGDQRSASPASSYNNLRRDSHFVQLFILIFMLTQWENRT